MKKEEAKKKYSELFKGAAFNVLKTPPQGESYECFKKRITDFYNEYLCESKVEYSFQNGELAIIQDEKVLDFSS